MNDNLLTVSFRSYFQVLLTVSVFLYGYANINCMCVQTMFTVCVYKGESQVYKSTKIDRGDCPTMLFICQSSLIKTSRELGGNSSW